MSVVVSGRILWLLAIQCMPFQQKRSNGLLEVCLALDVHATFELGKFHPYESVHWNIAITFYTA